MEGDDLSKIRLRKLNLNAPILSTRRVSGSPRLFKSLDADLHQGSAQRVPFSWEQVPGTPKGAASREIKASQFKPPRLPPCQWHSTMNCAYKANPDEEDDLFSDAIDRFSLSESLDVVDSTSNSRGLTSLDLKMMESRETRSPDFIIRRFLPDANAIASTYELNIPPRMSIDSQMLHRRYDRPAAVGKACSPPKACGIGFLLLPKRIKHTVCGLKDPILRRQSSHNVKRVYNARQSQGASVEVFCKGGGRVHLNCDNKRSSS